MSATPGPSGGVAQLAERPPFKRMREGSIPSTPTSPSPPYHALMDSTSERERELAALAAIQADLAGVDRALERIDDGSYGTCEACGQPIPDEVLDEAPVTRLCAGHAAPA